MIHTRSILVGAWVAAVAGAAAAYALRRARYHSVDPGRAYNRNLAPSLAWPIAGLALLLPLSLHALVGVAATPDGFHKSVAISCALVGHCHITLAIMGARRAVRLAHDEPALRPVTIYAVTVGLAMVPGAILMLVPPIIVGLTG